MRRLTASVLRQLKFILVMAAVKAWASVKGGTPGVFKMTPAGTLTTLASFDGTNGAARFLIQGRDGNFYGTTDQGGAYGLGAVFKMTPDGALTTLASITDTNAWPAYTIMQASDGTLYGTTCFYAPIQNSRNAPRERAVSVSRSRRGHIDHAPFLHRLGRSLSRW